MAKAKFYGVKAGLEPGVYDNWEDCKKQVFGFPGAEYKSFKTKEEAEQYVVGTPQAQQTSVQTSEPAVKQEELVVDRAKNFDTNQPIAFVDGSFNADKNIVGYGVVLMENGNTHVYQGSTRDEVAASMRNVSGEVQGAMTAVSEADRMGLKNLTIAYDYQGIEAWAKGDWKAKNPLTNGYAQFMNNPFRDLQVDFQKVKAHTGEYYNEVVDALAKEACGNALTPKQKGYIETVKSESTPGKSVGLDGLEMD